MAGVLIYSDKDQFALEMITAAKQIGRDFKAVTLNNDGQAQALAAAGADTFKINNSDIVQADVAAVAAALQQAADKLDTDIILLASNRRGKELAGRLAQITGAGCITDVAGIKAEGNKIVCRRNTLGGATVATQYIAVQRQVIAIMPRTFEPAGAGSGKISELEVAIRPSGVKMMELKSKSIDSVDIEAASILVAVGEGLNSQADLGMIETLAQKLGGVIACSKPVATDKKWLPEDRIIGLSGKKCKPELAILLGISGQVQFTVGIRDAKIIVAVNTDENAPINQMADYILNADLHEVAAGLNKALV